MAAIELTNLSKSFHTRRGQVRAVSALTLHARDGERMVLVGPSGCGKTTTLRLIAGLERPDAGTIRIGERAVNDLPPRDRDLAMVFQDDALYSHMTVFGNVAFGLKMRGVGRAEIASRVHEAAARLGFASLLDRKPASLSGGQRQRVALARAVVRRPAAFLLDEPLTSLDAPLRRELRTELKSLHAGLSTTMLYVTHDQEEAMTLGERLVVMRDGVVQQIGPPSEVYDRPANCFVASFLGNPPMNLIRGKVHVDAESGLFACPFGRLALPPDVVRSLRAHGERAAMLGIRPQHVRTVMGERRTGTDTEAMENAQAMVPAGSAEWSGTPSGGFQIGDLTVSAIEPLGDRTCVLLSAPCGDTILALSDPGVPLRPGRPATAVFPASAAHFFTADEPGWRLV